MPTEIETANRFLVGAKADRFVIQNPPIAPISREDALLLAAWLVALADQGGRFEKVLKAVRST